MMNRLLVTGANGNLGRGIFQSGTTDAGQCRAAVRSKSALSKLEELGQDAPSETLLVDYSDLEQMTQAARDCSAVIHLVGIIKEGAGATYKAAHEDSCSVLAEAASAAGVQRIVYLSILGSTPASSNTCLASKGRAEQILVEGAVPVTVLRVPMVLGRGDYATASLKAQASSSSARLVGGGRTLQQPIDARDVVSAALAASRDLGTADHIYDLGGPECLAHRDLVARAARVLGRSEPKIGAVPLPAARLFAAVVGRLAPNPPITSAMLEVLQHDDRVDSNAACEALGISLTPLDDTLAHCFAAE